MAESTATRNGFTVDYFQDAVENFELTTDSLSRFSSVFSEHERDNDDDDDDDDDDNDNDDLIDEYEKINLKNFDINLLKFKLGPKKLLLRDKLAFVIGSSHLWLSAYWLGCCQDSFYKLYIVEAIILVSLRFFLYKRQRMHYYLFDFCYFANALLIIQLLCFTKSMLLFKVSFAFNMGPLAWAVIAFRNSLVYHSLDKVTSLFLHFYPMVISWILRWYPNCNLFDCEKIEKEKDFKISIIIDLIFLPLIPYLLWAIGYYMKIFVISTKKIQDRGYDTLFLYFTSQKNTFFTKALLSFPKKRRPMVYMLSHLGFCSMTLIFTLFWWYSYLAHTMFLILIILISFWNGASYYFDYFAQKYLKNIEEATNRK